MPINRRAFVVSAGAAVLLPRVARAATVTDATGRELPIPGKVARVFPAGPPAAILLYTLAPDLLLGWPRANRPEDVPTCCRMLALGLKSAASPGGVTLPISKA